MKVTFLTTVFAMLFTLPTFGFSLGDLLNLPGKTDKPHEASESASVTDSPSESASGAAASPDVGTFLKGISGQTQSNPGGSEAKNPDSPSKARVTGGGCQKNPETGVIDC